MVGVLYELTQYYSFPVLFLKEKVSVQHAVASPASLLFFLVGWLSIYSFDK